MKKGLKRIIAIVLILVIPTGMLLTIANANLTEKHTVQNDGLNCDLPKLPTASNNYILLKNTESKDVVLLVGVDGGYFGSDTKSIFNYNFEYNTTSFNIYVSTFTGTTYSYWVATAGTARFSLSGYEIIYKSKDMYPSSPIGLKGHIFIKLPEGVTWDDKIIMTCTSDGYKLYKPSNNLGMWVDSADTNCDFVYRDTLTSANQTVNKYKYNHHLRTWTKETFWRTEGFPDEIFYVGSDVFSTDGTVKRVGQRDFYTQSSESQDDELIYDLSSLLTTNSYVILKHPVSKLLVLLIGEDNGYFGSSTDTLWNYDSLGNITNFTASYISSFDGKEYGGWESTNIGNSFSLLEYKIIYKSKDMYPSSPIGLKGHIFIKLPEGVTWDDKIIMTCTSDGYKLYKPSNNLGMWVDSADTNCDFVYRDTLTSANQTVNKYKYNHHLRTWTKGTFGRTEGVPDEIFYVGSDVFSTDGTVKRAGQRDFYAQSSKLTGFQFEPLNPLEAKEFLAFIANVSESKIEKNLPKYYDFLIGTIEDPEEELKVKLSLMTYIYYCLDMQLAQSKEKIEIGTTYLINWAKENSQEAQSIFNEIKDELWNDLKATIAKGIDIPEMSSGYDLVTDIIEYGELLIHIVGSILEIQQVNDIKYLRAYLKLLEAEYNNDQYHIMLWQFNCDNITNGNAFIRNPQKIRKYAEYIFNIEHSIFINPSAN